MEPARRRREQLEHRHAARAVSDTRSQLALWTCAAMEPASYGGAWGSPGSLRRPGRSRNGARRLLPTGNTSHDSRAARRAVAAMEPADY
jgi:hypothetical protein